jgi:hypothetical protein
VQLANIIPLNISLPILHKIQFLCKSIPKVEWSGVLFYSVTGSIKDPTNFKIEIEDILPLDVGTSVFTSYDLDNRFIDYLMEDPKRMKFKVGHIHSHNIMSVFFSGTDMEELNDSASAYNYYLSLIVNNYMDMTAKVAFVANATATIQKVDYVSLDENGKPFSMSQKDFTFEKEILYMYDCGITVPSIDIVVEDSFAKKVAVLLVPKPVVKHVPIKPLIPVVNRILPVHTPKGAPQSSLNKYKDFFSGSEFSSLADLIDDEDDEDYEESAEKLLSFATSLFSNSTQLLSDETLDEVLLSLLDMEVDPTDIAKKVLDVYATNYSNQFPEKDDVDFIADTYEVLDILYDVPSALTTLTNPTIRVIEMMVKAFQSDARTV